MMRYFKMLVAALITVLCITGCEKNLSEENGNLPGGGTTNGTGTTTAPTGSSVADCKACTYIPMCNNSVYQYSDTGFTATGTPVNFTIHFEKDTTIGTVVYQKYTTENAQPSYYNCTAGVSTVIGINGTTVAGAPVEFVKLTLLKANEAVGASWTDINTNGGQQFTYTSSIIEKGVTRVVKGITYTDVIKVHVTTTIDVAGGTIPAGQSDYYYAKGKGLIENITIDDFSGTQILHRVLISAVIP